MTPLKKETWCHMYFHVLFSDDKKSDDNWNVYTNFYLIKCYVWIV